MSDDQRAREVEALLDLSRRARGKLDRLHAVLTSHGHYGTGASPAAVVYRENKLRLLRLLDDTSHPRTGPPVLFVPAPVSRYFLRGLPASLRFLRHVPSLLRSRGCLPP